jgi:hypothetical protein
MTTDLNKFYKVVQKVVYNDPNSFSFIISPTNFPFNGLCKISLTSIFGSNFTKGPDSVVVRLNVSQPFSQSNFLSTATAPQYNPNQVIFGSVLDKNATQFGQTDLVMCFILAHVTAGTKVTISVTDLDGNLFAGTFSGMLMFDIEPIHKQ